MNSPSPRKKKPPSETPEQHVQSAVTRQKRVAKTAEDKAQVLAIATETLSNRVAVLADAVQTNNCKIDELRSEVDKKPDDVELTFIAGLANLQRRRQFKYSVATALVSSFLAGGISIYYANQQVQERTKANFSACERNNKRADVIAEEFRTIATFVRNPDIAREISEAAGRLDGLRANCKRLHPIK